MSALLPVEVLVLVRASVLAVRWTLALRHVRRGATRIGRRTGKAAELVADDVLDVAVQLVHHLGLGRVGPGHCSARG